MQNDGNTSPISQFFRGKWGKVTLTVGALIIVAIIGILILNATKATVNFNVTPVDATIQLNGQGDYENGTYQIYPGHYEVIISRDGLNSKAIDLDLQPGDNIAFATFLSGEEDNFDFYTLKNNYASYRKLTEIASTNNNQTTDHDTSAEYFISKIEYAMSIFEALPIKEYIYADPEVHTSTGGFAIRDGENQERCEKITCLLVNYYGAGYEEAVIKSLESIGYSPADYQIIYERYTSVQKNT